MFSILEAPEDWKIPSQAFGKPDQKIPGTEALIIEERNWGSPPEREKYQNFAL